MKNKYAVPVKKWRKWSARAHFVFNELYGAMTGNAWVFQHPSMEDKPIKPSVWKTTAWNASWIAADAADNIQACTEVLDINIRTGKEVSRRALKAA